MSICNNKNTNNFNFIGETEFESGAEKLIFSISFVFEYFFEKEQILKFEVFEQEENKKWQTFSVVGKIMGSRHNTLTVPISEHDPDLGELTIDCKNANKSVEQLTFSVSCTITKSNSDRDLFYLLSNINDGKNWRRVYKSPEVYCESNSLTKYGSVSLMGDDVCGMDLDRKIKFDFQDLADGVVGSTLVSLNDLKSNRTWPMLDSNNKQVGVTYITYEESKLLRFIDYIVLGMQINLIVGIDFTCSNVNPELPESLHYYKGTRPSPYERAIESCGSVVAYYDYDQSFPVYGFGGRPPGQTKADHCFNLNLMPNPDVNGLDGIIQAYRNAVLCVKQDGPTFFAPIIRQVLNNVKNEVEFSPDLHKYYILMIITDGIINDMDQTCDVVVECAKYPISIIIIGVGNADFTNMNILDGDDDPLTNFKGEKTKRDLVQFVEFKKFENDVTVLAEEVLKEVPRQVEEYYKLSNRQIN